MIQNPGVPGQTFVLSFPMSLWNPKARSRFRSFHSSFASCNGLSRKVAESVEGTWGDTDPRPNEHSTLATEAEPTAELGTWPCQDEEIAFVIFKYIVNLKSVYTFLYSLSQHVISMCCAIVADGRRVVANEMHFMLEGSLYSEDRKLRFAKLRLELID